MVGGKGPEVGVVDMPGFMGQHSHQTEGLGLSDRETYGDMIPCIDGDGMVVGPGGVRSGVDIPKGLYPEGPPIPLSSRILFLISR